MAQKPSIPKGTRDFSPEEVAKRNYIIRTMSKQFSTFGFQPIETPSFEKSVTLLGKYGDEGDRLIFKILNSGDFLKKVDNSVYEKKDSGLLAGQIAEKALRYDLTVPFARYVVQHQAEIDLPFKRYQIQPVWRADRPQKGRFREFYQCDADVVGSDSLWQEVELVMLYDNVFSELNLEGVSIKLNNRKVLAGLAEVLGVKDRLIDFTVALDKLDKIGPEGVATEMAEKGISQPAIDRLKPLLKVGHDNRQQIDVLSDVLADSETGKSGIAEIEFILQNTDSLGLKTATVQVDLTLARGLNYYTGAIFEVSPPAGVKMGSIGGGGRYDDLTGIFGLKNISGVGISFGLDRIYLVLDELGLFPKTVVNNTRVLFINFGQREALYAMRAVSALREEGINAELYPDASKMGKQLGYADKRSIPYAVLAGESEMEQGMYTLKDMISGEQRLVDIDRLASILR